MIKKVRVTEKEYSFMIKLLYEEIVRLKDENKDATEFIVLLRKVLPNESGSAMNRAKRIIESSVSQFNDLENDPINDVLRKETDSRIGQAGCRGDDCD